MRKVKAIQWLAALIALTAISYTLPAQCLSGNCQNGEGMFQFTSGAKYSGDFYGGRPHGNGTLKYTNGNRYTGQWKTGMRDGQGKMTFENGNVYEGNFSRNKMEGQGTMSYQNQDRYKGLWSNNAPEGSGVYFFKSGERYEGNFSVGKFEGMGTMYYVDGAQYTGQWRDNRKHGQGRMQLPDGSASTAYWENGEIRSNTASNTEQATTTPDASTTPTGQTADVSKLRNCGTVHCRSGKGFLDYSDGSRYVGEFNDGYPEGMGKCYYANGDLYEGGWKNNAPNGEGIMNFSSGRVYAAVWMNGSPVRELDKQESLPELEETPPVDVSKNVKIWAVVVGVSSYAYMPKLKFTDDDAYQYFAFLKSPEGGALPDNQIELLIDDHATRQNILTAMQRTFARADANDEIVLYFSGHGLEGCFLPVDFDGHNNKLRHDEVLRIFAGSQAKYKLCIADACHSGTLNNDQGLVAKSPVMVTLDRYYQAFENSNGGTALLMSSKGEEVSLEDHGLRQGIFSHYLLKGLKGKADANTDHIVTIQELYAYIYGEVRSYTNNAQTPILTGDFDPNMPAAVKRW